MPEAIVVAIIAVVGNILVTYLTNKKTISLLEYRIKCLEDKVNIHNNLIDRMYHAETDIALLQNDIDEMKKGQG